MQSKEIHSVEGNGGIRYTIAPVGYVKPRQAARATYVPCPNCKGSNITCLETRKRVRTNDIRRKQFCQDCNANFSTIETIG